MSHNLMHVASIYPAYPIYRSYTSDLYILRVPSIYPTYPIYMTDVQHLYILRHRYIDAKRTVCIAWTVVLRQEALIPSAINRI